MQTIKEVTKRLAGSYNPAAFAVYCILATGIDESEHGEFHFSLNDLIDRLTYRIGKRPVKTSKDVIRKVIDRFWEDGIFEFNPSSQGNIARFPKGEQEWKSTRKIV